MLAAFLRICNLGKYDLWYDEAIRAIDSARGLLSIQPVNRLLELKSDVVIDHFQDYLLLYTHGLAYYWRKIFGNSESVLRFSSVIAAVLTIYILYKFCARLFSEKIGQLSCILLATAPLHIYYSQEFGPYIFLPPFALISFYSFIEIFETKKKRFWFYYVISEVLMIYFNWLSIISLVSFLALFLFKLSKGELNKREITAFVLSHAVIFILISPCIVTILHLLNYYFNSFSTEISRFYLEFPSWSQKITPMHIVYLIKNFALGYNTSMNSWLGVSSLVFYLIFFILGLPFKYKHQYKLLFFLFAPVIIFFLISQIKICFVYRYMFFLLPFFLIYVSFGLSRLKGKALAAVLTAVLFFNILSISNYYRDLLPQNYDERIGVVEKTLDIKDLAGVLSTLFKKEDKIFHSCKKTIFPLKFYSQGGNNLDFAKEAQKGSIIFLTKDKKLSYVDYELTHPRQSDLKNIKRLEDLPSRAWIVFSTFDSRKIEKTEAAEYDIITSLESHYARKWHKRFEDVDLYLFYRN